MGDLYNLWWQLPISCILPLALSMVRSHGVKMVQWWPCQSLYPKKSGWISRSFWNMTDCYIELDGREALHIFILLIHSSSVKAISGIKSMWVFGWIIWNNQSRAPKETSIDPEWINFNGIAPPPCSSIFFVIGQIIPTNQSFQLIAN